MTPQPDLFSSSLLVTARPDRNVQAPLLDEVHIPSISRVQVRVIAKCDASTEAQGTRCAKQTHTHTQSVRDTNTCTTCCLPYPLGALQIQMYNAWRDVETTAFAMRYVSSLSRGFVALVGSASTGTKYSVTVPTSKVRGRGMCAERDN